MLDRFYLGTTIDVNKERYLPIMKEGYEVINTLSDTIYGLAKFGEDKITYHDKYSITIRKIDTLELVEKISTPHMMSFVDSTNSVSGIHADYENQKIYCMVVTSSNVFAIAIYDLTTKTWGEIIPSFSGSHYGDLANLYVEGDFLYFSNKTYVYKLSISTNTQIAQVSFYQSYPGFVIDGDYLYVFHSLGESTYSLASKKYNKNDFSLVATGVNLTSHSSKVFPTNIITKDGFIYVVHLGSLSSTNPTEITKIRMDDLTIISKVKVNTAIRGISFSEKGRLYGTYANITYEINPDTLSTTIVATVGGSYITTYDKTDTLISGGSQLERTYTVQSYKKILE